VNVLGRGNAVVTVEHLRKRYGETVAVDDVSFEVDEGEIFGLIGPNGAGKTTTVECLQGLRRPDAGAMRVLGLDPMSEAGALRRVIGAQLQESSLPDRIRVWEALDLFAAFAESPADWKALLEQWGLRGRLETPFASLSGGQRQRLFVALALVNQPRLVFLDEVTQGLDPQARRAAWEVIRAVRDQGTTVVLVTHFMDEAEQLCDRVAIVESGRIVALDTPARLVDALDAAVSVRFSAASDELGWLEGMSEVQTVTRRGDEVEVTGTGPLAVLVSAALVAHGLTPTDLRVQRPSLEDVFLTLTGRRVEE
jgi:ABC-2 type transport system ATP-binding protein